MLLPAKHSSKVGEGIGAMTALGIEPIAFGDADPDFIHSADRRFFAIWRATDRDALAVLVDGIAVSGWHDFFDTINAAGPATGIAEHLTQLAGV